MYKVVIRYLGSPSKAVLIVMWLKCYNSDYIASTLAKDKVFPDHKDPKSFKTHREKERMIFFRYRRHWVSKGRVLQLMEKVIL